MSLIREVQLFLRDTVRLKIVFYGSSFVAGLEQSIKA